MVRAPAAAPLERVNREIGRRTDVGGIFCDDQVLLQLAGALLIEQNDGWLVTRRCLSEDSMGELLTARTGPENEIGKWGIPITQPIVRSSC